MNTNNEVKKGRGRPPRRILTPTEDQNLRGMVETDAQSKVESEYFYPSDPSLLRGKSEQIKRIENTIKNGQPDSHNKWDKAKLEKRAEELQTWLIPHMVPRNQLGLRMSKDGVQSSEFQKAKNFMAQREMSSEFQQVASEYKNIMRDLGRPEEANLENIRPETN